MKLPVFELNKVVNKKAFYIFLFLCFLINIFLFYFTQKTEENQTRFEHSEEYITVLEKYSKLSIKDAQKAIEKDRLAYSIASQISLLPQLDDEEEIEYYTGELEKYKSSSPDVYKKALEISESTRDDMNEYVLINLISNQIDYIKSYPEFIGGMRSRAIEQSKLSGYNDKNSFSYKNLYKTSGDYNHLKENELTLVNSDPVTAAVKFGITDMIIMRPSQILCKSPIWCRIEAPYWRF